MSLHTVALSTFEMYSVFVPLIFMPLLLHFRVRCMIFHSRHFYVEKIKFSMLYVALQTKRTQMLNRVEHGPHSFLGSDRLNLDNESTTSTNKVL